MSHGSTPAAWTTVALMLIGFVVCAVALIPHPNWVVFGVGALIVVASLVVGKAMVTMGLGEEPGH